MEGIVFVATILVCCGISVLISKYRSKHMPEFFNAYMFKDYNAVTDALIVFGIVLSIAAGFVAYALL